MKQMNAPVQVSFLGGANEVGASCCLLQIGNHRIAIDCGIRMAKRQSKDRLPNLAELGSLDELDALILTHAHMDHTGAAPLLFSSGKQIPVLTTAPTKDIMEVLLRDALKIMEDQNSNEDELPLYPAPTVDALLGACKVTAFLEPIELAGGKIVVTFIPAGHILGAAMVSLETKYGQILFTGDFSVGAQRTVPGCTKPQRADFVICESTYGGRLHSNREIEEKKLIDEVAKCLAEDGKVLIPAFALGRAQEVIVILERAMGQGRLKKVPVYIDGMVRKICSIYSRYPELLQRPLRKRIIKKSEDPFFGDGTIVSAVKDNEQREAIVKGPPCVVVASSGMLSGGASVFYASQLVQDPKNAIILTGYQDEEAPGRRLMELASGKNSTIALAGNEFEVSARVAACGLSAHADEAEIVSLLHHLSPKEVMFVHGDQEARNCLAKASAPYVRREVHLPESGDTIRPTNIRGRGLKTRRTMAGINEGATLDDEGLERLWLYLFQRDGNKGSYTIGTLLDTWYGTNKWNESKRQELTLKLLQVQAGYEANPKRPFLFSLVEPTVPQKPSTLDEATSLEKARTLFSKDKDFLKVGIQNSEIIVTFAFPDTLSTNTIEDLDKLSIETGRTVRLREDANIESLQTLVRTLLKDKYFLTKNGSVHLGQKLVQQSIEKNEQISAKEESELCQKFLALTGFRLELTAQEKTTYSKKKVFGDNGVMEINTAFTVIRQAFSQRQHQPRKMSKKFHRGKDFIILSFISPQIGERYNDLLDELEQETRWPIDIGPSVDQNGLISLARQLLAPLGDITKGPSILQQQGIVRLSLKRNALCTDEKLDEVNVQFQDESGFELEVE